MVRGTKSSAPFRSASGSVSGPSLSNGNSVSSPNNASHATTASSHAHLGEGAMHPNLGLHTAAATGNVGLVKFALENGQPHYSLLNGLVPLHAACSGGNETVIQMLLSYGADVNAVRAKLTKGAGQGVGSEGSTPLHFAAANGHATIVRLLLERGARPSAQDKAGLTAEALASAQGHASCVTILRAWVASYGPNGLAGATLRANDGPTGSSSSIRSQRSFESLSSAAAGVKATLRNHKRQALAKVSSNPNLKSSASTSSNTNLTSSPVPPLPKGRMVLDTAAASQNTLPSPTVTNFSSRDARRRPSLPSIFERNTQVGSKSVPLPVSSPSRTESIEELSHTSKDVRAADGSISLPGMGAHRLHHRLTGKRSLTGLLNRAGGDASPSIAEQRSPREPVRAADERPFIPDMSSLSMSPSSSLQGKTKARSGSSDLLAHVSQSTSARPDIGNSFHSSPASSTENIDWTTKSTGAMHAFRPRKSSNLSTAANSSSMNEGDASTATSSNEQGRQRSQSTTNAASTRILDTDSHRHPILSAQRAVQARSAGERQERETVKSPTHLSVGPRSKSVSRQRSDLSPRLGTNMLASESEATALMSLAGGKVSDNVEDVGGSHPTRTFRSPSHSESLMSKASSSSLRSFAALTAQEQAQAILRSAEDNAGALGAGATSASSNGEPSLNLTQMLAAYGEALAQERRGNGPSSPLQMRRQASQASFGSSSRHPPTSNSCRSMPLLNHQQNNQTIFASEADASRPSLPGLLTPISTPPDSPQITRSRAESSATSFSRSPSSHRQQRKPQRSLNEIVTGESSPALSPMRIVAKADPSDINKSPDQAVMSPPSTDPSVADSESFQHEATHLKGRPGLMAGSSASPAPPPPPPPPPPHNAFDTPSHRHSPSMPGDLSYFGSFTNPHDDTDSTETTPRSKRRIQHRSTTSDSNAIHPSLLLPTRSDSLASTAQAKLHASTLDVTASPANIDEAAVSAEYAKDRVGEAKVRLSTSNGSLNQHDDSNAVSGRSGKRKGSVKAFLHGIKHNVVGN